MTIDYAIYAINPYTWTANPFCDLGPDHLGATLGGFCCRILWFGCVSTCFCVAIDDWITFIDMEATFVIFCSYDLVMPRLFPQQPHQTECGHPARKKTLIRPSQKLSYKILMYPTKKTNIRNLKNHLKRSTPLQRSESSEPKKNWTFFSVPSREKNITGGTGWERGHGPGWDRVMYLHDALNGSSELGKCKWSLGVSPGLVCLGIIYGVYTNIKIVYIYTYMHKYICICIYSYIYNEYIYICLL